MSTVIKAGQAGGVVRKLSTVDLADHLREAAEIIAHARAEAESIRTEARARSRREANEAGERARREGHDRGYQEGISAGREAAFGQAKKEFDQRHNALASMFVAAIHQIEAMKERLRLDAERDVLDFAILVASKLTVDVGELRRNSVVENFRRCLALISDKTHVSVRCHPIDAETMRTFAADAASALQSASHFHVVEDDSLSPGGCVVQSGNALVDGSIETQVAEMTSILTGRTRSG